MTQNYQSLKKWYHTTLEGKRNYTDTVYFIVNGYCNLSDFINILLLSVFVLLIASSLLFIPASKGNIM